MEFRHLFATMLTCCFRPGEPLTILRGGILVPVTGVEEEIQEEIEVDMEEEEENEERLVGTSTTSAQVLRQAGCRRSTHTQLLDREWTKATQCHCLRIKRWSERVRATAIHQRWI